LKSMVARTNEEEVLKILSEQAPVGVCIVQDGKFCYVNSYFSTITGYTADELVGKDSFMLVVPEDREMSRNNCIKMLKGELLSPYQFRVTCKDGSIILVMSTARSIQYHERRAILGNYMEITERERAERRIQESERRYRLLAENAEDVIWTVDIACPTRLTYISPSVTRLLGYSVEETMAKEMEVIFTPASFNSAMKAFVEEIAREQKEHAAQHRSRRLELQLRHKNGSLVDVEVNYSFILGADGQKHEILAVARDITERKQAEEALRESEEWYQALFDRSLDCVYVHDFEGNFLDANETALKLLGYEREDIPHLNFASLLSQDQLPKALAALQELKDTGIQKQVNEFRVRCKDGSFVDMEVISAVIYRDGKPYAIQGVGRDVTERKGIEETLRESEERYRELANSITDVFFAMDEHLRYTYWNKASEILTGIRAEDAIEKSLRQIFPDTPGVRRAQKMYRKVLRTQQPQTFVNDYDNDGRHYIFEISAYPTRAGIAVFVKDITEHKQMEDAVRQSEENYRTLSEQAPVGVCVMQDGKFCYFNSNFPIATGYTADELIGKDPLELIVPEDREMVRENEIKMLKGELIQPYQFRVIHKDGSIRWVMEAVRSVQYHGRRAVLGHYMEVTERKQMEDRLKESEQKYRLLFESSPDSIAQLDREGRYLAANPATARSLGVPLEELVGKTMFEVVPQEVAQYRLGMVRKVLDEWQPQIFEDERAGRYFHHIVIPTKISEQKEAVQVITRDITERKQAEEALRQSEEKHRALFDSSVIGMFVMNAETMKIVMCNQAAANMFGFSSVEEAVGINPVDFIIPEEREKGLEIIIKEMFEQDLRRTHEFRALTKDGREGWISVTGARIMHEGRLAGLVSITNITKRKKMEEALNLQRAYFQQLFDNSPDAIVMLDINDRLSHANKGFEALFGYSAEELQGQSIRKLIVPEEDTQITSASLQRVFSGEVVRRETVRRHKDGNLVDVSILSYPIHLNYKVVGACLTYTDITEHKQAEEKLRQSEERYRALFDSSVIGTLILDAETMQVLMGNEAAMKIFGFSSLEEGAGINVLDFVPQEDRELNRELIKRGLFEQDSRRHYDVRTITKDGREIWINVTGVRMMYKDRLAGMVTFTDITERKRAEEALQRSEERYRTILEEMEDAYSEVDLGGHLTFFNNSVCRYLGYSREELIGMSYKGFSAEDDIESVFRVFNEVYRTGVPNKGFPWKIIRKDGSYGFAETSVSPLKNDKDEIIGFRGVGRDITERKQAEEKLRQSEENYKTLFNSSVVGMYVMDAETLKVVMGNKAAREMIGFSSAEEGIGVNPFDFVVPEDRDKVLEIAINEFLQDSRQTHEIRVMDKDGRRGWQSISIARIMHKGRLASLVSFTDITERKRMEEALRQSEENYRALFDSSVIGTIVIDAETMKVVMANQAAAKTFGLGSAEEALEVDWLAFIRPEDKERVFEIAEKNLFEQDSQHTYELGAVTKDGREIWISATGAKIIHEGKLAGLISFTDITEQKRQNERLMMTDRLASLGELAAGAAHELNNPLTSIVGFSQLLMEKEVPGDIREDLKLISNEAQRAVSVTNNLLTFARKHAPMKQLNRINNIIEDVLELRAYEQEVNHIDVERHLATNLPEIMVDYFQMQQVFMNIIINAEYFMTEAHNRGTLTIATRKQNSTVRISITDDGPGITPENLKHIFDPFFTTKEAGKGTGLGLSICHGVVTEHGGQIYVRSQLGKGVTTFIELPIKSRTRIKSIL